MCIISMTRTCCTLSVIEFSSRTKVDARNAVI